MKVEISHGKLVQVSDDMTTKAKKALENTNKMLELFDTDFPEPKCNICGRVIYCGINSLCGNVPCGLKESK
jgi:hypothetical protein